MVKGRKWKRPLTPTSDLRWIKRVVVSRAPKLVEASRVALSAREVAWAVGLNAAAQRVCKTAP